MAKKLTEIICPICNKKANKYTVEVNRQLKIGRNVYCSRECSIVGIKNSHIKYPKYEKTCSICNKKFITSDAKKSKKFCSNICANNYSRQFVDKQKVSKSVKTAWKRGDFDHLKSKLKINNKYKLSCIICNKDFLNRLKNIKTCSKQCYLKLLSTQSRKNPNCGGETNYKKFIYNGVYMDSSWEVNLAKFLDLNNVEWKRSKNFVFLWTDKNNNKRRYYPDFYLPAYNLYLDPKNKFLLEKDEFKLNQVIKENNINLIYGTLDIVITELKNKILKGL
jgi:hypothetical protein